MILRYCLFVSDDNLDVCGKKQSSIKKMRKCFFFRHFFKVSMIKNKVLSERFLGFLKIIK